MGGWNGNNKVNSTIEMSGLEGGGQWKELPPSKTINNQFTGTILDNEIFVVGDSANIISPDCRIEIFNGERWRAGPISPNNYKQHSIVNIPQTLADHLCRYTADKCILSYLFLFFA